MPGCLKGLGHFSGSMICSTHPRLSHRKRLAQLHSSCWPWQSCSHPGMTKCWGIHCFCGAPSPCPFPGSLQELQSCQMVSSPNFSPLPCWAFTTTEAEPSPRAPHSFLQLQASATDLFSPCLKINTTYDTCIALSLSPKRRGGYDLSGAQLLYTDPEETLPRTFVFLEAGIFLIAVDFSTQFNSNNEYLIQNITEVALIVFLIHSEVYNVRHPL